MRKNNKRALIVSALSLLLCVSMLVGSTMAWFTDNASTAVNTIQAGTLDIDLLDKDNNSLDGQSLNFVDEEGNVKTNILWEPGARYLLQDVTLVNKGNLAVKYKVMLNYTDDDPDDGVDLGDVIDVYIGNDKQGTLSALSKEDNVNESTLLSNGTAKYTGLKLVMQEGAGNEYQGKSLSSIAVTVMAKQHTYETDSYDDQYDAAAEYATNVKNGKSLMGAVARGGNISVEEDVVIPLGKTQEENGGTMVAGVTHELMTFTEDAVLDLGSKTIKLEQSNNPGQDFGLIVNDPDTTVVLNANENGGINAVTDDIGYTAAIAIRANGGTVIINGGTYKANENAVYIYNLNTGKVIINGGFFETAGNEPWDLIGSNATDLNLDQPNCPWIQIYGGTFVNFNPSEKVPGADRCNYVMPGYHVESETQANGDIWYTVVAD